jgi:hypothetical protein
VSEPRLASVIRPQRGLSLEVTMGGGGGGITFNTFYTCIVKSKKTCIEYERGGLHLKVEVTPPNLYELNILNV